MPYLQTNTSASPPIVSSGSITILVYTTVINLTTERVQLLTECWVGGVGGGKKEEEGGREEGGNGSGVELRKGNYHGRWEGREVWQVGRELWQMGREVSQMGREV